MKERSFSLALMLAVVALVFVPVAAHAQSATPTPTATATPAGGCALTLPDGQPPNCRTGGYPPPAFLGISGGNINSVFIDPKSGVVGCCSGTLGALVQDASPSPGATPAQYVLSTNHAFARNGGRGARAKEAIVQPGPFDIGCWQAAEDTVAELSKWTTINFKGKSNELDAAIARVVLAADSPGGPLGPGVDTLGEIFNLGVEDETPGQISTTPFPYDSLIDGLEVMKMGSSSCLTSGKVEAFDAMGIVNYQATCNAAGSGPATFDHQIIVVGQPFSGFSNTTCSFAANGDSGAVVLTYNPDSYQCLQAVGIVFAGSSGTDPDTAGVVVAVNPMQTPTHTGVLDKFHVSLVGDNSCTPPSPIGVAAHPIARMSSAMHKSINLVRKAKETYGHRLLKNHAVVAVGIATGDSPDTAVLNVYLSEDTPEIRSKVLKEIHNRSAVRFKHAAKFQAL